MKKSIQLKNKARVFRVSPQSFPTFLENKPRVGSGITQLTYHF